MKITLLWPVTDLNGDEVIWEVTARYTPPDRCSPTCRREDAYPDAPAEVEILGATRDLYGHRVTATAVELAMLRADVRLDETLCEEGRRRVGEKAKERRAAADWWADIKRKMALEERA